MYDLIEKIRNKTVTVAVLGLGYVGLPLAHAFWRAGIRVTGFDIASDKVKKLNKGMSYISSIASATIGNMVRSDNFKATSDFDALADIDAILICVPTPLGPTREPDLAPVVTATETIARHFKKGSLVVL